MNDPPLTPRRTFADLEGQHDIPPDTYRVLTPQDMSRAIGYMPVGSVETRLGSLRAEFGPDADIGRIRLQEQFFGACVDHVLHIDWMLATDEFDRHVREGLARHFPELTAEARNVVAGDYSYSHAN